MCVCVSILYVLHFTSLSKRFSFKAVAKESSEPVEHIKARRDDAECVERYDRNKKHLASDADT